MNNQNTKKVLLVMSVVMLFSLTACKDKGKNHYKNYVKSLIAINYLGAGDDYKDTGASKQDAEALYESNIEYFADQIISYYNVTLSDASTMRDEYVKLAKNIYSKVNYSVSAPYQNGDTYFVDVTIYPIDIFNQTYDDVYNYVSDFNTGVQNGDYNSYTLEQYETEFSTGLLNILNTACIDVKYADPVTITVEIIEDGNSFYISDADFQAIDAAMIAAGKPANPEE